jgi:hypothetical protein
VRLEAVVGDLLQECPPVGCRDFGVVDADGQGQGGVTE